jgi:natural product biosynthesis luciferase-like monooxygenase protein
MRARTATPSIPIGRPIANTQLYILDAQLQPVPIGVAGELFVGGAGLALGYLNRPDLTAERFVPNPWGSGVRGQGSGTTDSFVRTIDDRRWTIDESAPSSIVHRLSSNRLYKTGDLARYWPDGTLEFLGRRDQQAKIRGYRVELGEVEQALQKHPGLRESAVVLRDSGGEQQLVAYVVAERARAAATKAIDFGLFYFAADEATQDKYRLYIETAKFADQHGFSAVWTPERHFHAVGGLYPNPATLSAALAMVTERIQLRAGSVVLPLQHPLRVAEEWSVVDNLSNGRAGIACVSGWVPNDFAFFPDHFADKRSVMFQGLEEVRRLWRGEAIPAHDGLGNPVELRIFPRPVQPELPIWLTCNRAPELFEQAGELGVNVLTALLNQTLEEAAAHIQLYRDARARHGHDPAAGRVTMMLHTFVADAPAEVLERAREPFCRYMLSHVGLIESWLNSLNIAVDVDRKEGLADLVAFAFERYYQTASLIGTPETCLQMIERLHAIGVDEVGCLIDFGIDLAQVMQSLQRLDELRERIRPAAAPSARALRSFLKTRLPDYMLPTSFVFIDALPRTPSGKLDRRGLVLAPAPEPPAALVLPQTPTEATLAAIWRDVLQLERVGIHDNFFEIGGHSLKATQLMAHVRQRFGVELAVQHVFSAPTINNMAAVVDDALLAQASVAQLNQLLDLLDDMDEEAAQAALRG